MFKRYFLTGLLVLVPLAITIWVITSLIHFLDQTLIWLPYDYQPRNLFGFDIPGLGVVLTVSVILGIGLLASNLFGRQFLKLWEVILSRLPFINSIYSSIKQVSDTLFSESGRAFNKAVLIRYPDRDTYTIAFLTGEPSAEITKHLKGKHISVYVPTTPNPTSGYFLMVAKKDIVELDISVDQALKYVISMGVVPPSKKSKKLN